MLTKPSGKNRLKVSRLARVAGLAAASLALMAGTAVGETPKESDTSQTEMAPQGEMADVRRQLVEIDQRINAVEKKAMQDPEPIEAEASYVEELKKAAIAKAPEIQDKLERQEELISELGDSPQLKLAPEERSPDFSEKLEEFKGLRNEINPVVQSVSSEPDVRKSYQTFQKTVVEKMKELEPETEQLLAQRAELADRFQELSVKTQ